MENNLFNSSGYILAKDYVDDIRQMQKRGPWKLPLGVGDRFHLFLLSLFLKFSWFKDVYIKYPHDHSPAYDIIINFLNRNKMLSTVNKINTASYWNINIYSTRLLDGEEFLVKSSGHHKNSDIAFSKTIGELIERVVSGLYDENRNFVVGSFSELKIKYKNIFYPPIYHRFLPQQKDLFKELRVDDNQAIEWVKGFNFLTNEVALIPKSLTSWRHRKSIITMNPTTSGSAGGFSKEDVIKNSILEYIERDSFLVHWLTQIAPKVIANESLPEELLLYVKDFNSIGVDVYVLNTTTNVGIPSACVVVRKNNLNKKSVAVSGGAGIDLHSAIRKALEEAQQCVANLDWGRSNVEVSNFIPFVSDIDREKRITMWQGEGWVKLFEWFISGDVFNYTNNSVSTFDGEREIDTLKNIFTKLGSEYTPLIYFPKNKAMGKLGFHVAQSFIPFCFPLFLLEKYGTFDSDRLKQFARYKGVENFKLNPYPHPFP
jgi:thiazole/oxazole-forming peptide maturase SagD family component